MRAVIQKVDHCEVMIDQKKWSQIEKGLVIFVGFHSKDNESSLQYMLEKTIHLRIFEDENNKMNLSLVDVKGQLMIVPNFTLYADARKGRRPSFSLACKGEVAENYFNDFVAMAKKENITVSTGKFQAEMKVKLTNDGPITLLLDSDKLF